MTDVKAVTIRSGETALGSVQATDRVIMPVGANLQATNVIEGFATTAMAGGTTTLTVNSAYTQYFTGGMGASPWLMVNQTLQMPVVTTLVAGQQYMVVNNSYGLLTVNSSGGNLITTIPGNTSALITCKAIAADTTAAAWNVQKYSFPETYPVMIATTGANDGVDANKALAEWTKWARNADASKDAGGGFAVSGGTNTTSTYTLTYTVVNAYYGGVLAPNGDIHLVPFNATVGQRIISGTNTTSTYALTYTAGGAYIGGVLAPNGDIHLVPLNATVGQRIISGTNTTSTYALTYTVGNAYIGGVLAPNGDIHFVPYNATVGQRIISGTNTTSTYALTYTVANAYTSGVLAPNGDIHLVPLNATVGQRVSTLSSKPYSIDMAKSAYVNIF